jgi:siroheme synthase-like protein
MNNLTPGEANPLFPVFLKLHSLHLLVIGGGKVGKEKLDAILANSPRSRIRLVAKEFSREVLTKVAPYSNVDVIEAAFNPSHLENIDVVICAIDDPTVSEEIRVITRKAGILSNFADKPGLCDFYLGSVVQKGHVKIGISTNGKSPTLAKRLKEIIDTSLPDELNDIVGNLSAIRSTVEGDIEAKIKVLNEATLAYRKKQSLNPFQRILKGAVYTAAILLIMISGHIIISNIWNGETHAITSPFGKSPVETRYTNR